MQNKICATIILYNPTQEIFNNINSYIDAVETLIVVDNSDTKNTPIIQKLLNKHKKIIYIFNAKNLGIATALNIACDKAIELKYSWILTMDQDSKFVNIDKFISCSKNIMQKEQNIGIITPNHSHIVHKEKQNCNYETKEFVITSGNLVNLKEFNEIGRYNDKLFIDMVDYDFSNKVLLKKLKIFLTTNIYITHHIGEIFKRKNIISRKIREKTEHNPQRTYYITRNRLYLWSKYSKTFPKEYNLFKTINILFIHDITKIILYEGDKSKKIYAKILGLLHFIQGKMGRYDI